MKKEYDRIQADEGQLRRECRDLEKNMALTKHDLKEVLYPKFPKLLPLLSQGRSFSLYEAKKFQNFSLKLENLLPVLTA
jgi:hypothetical protein